MASDHAWIGAAEAARLLQITRTTLYAYVSRGFIRSQSKPGGTRERRYSRDDVERLRRRTDARRDPDKAATHTLRWGMPVLESSITLIDDDTLYYRGHDAVTLSRSRSLAEVAALIWTGSLTGLTTALPGATAFAHRASARSTARDALGLTTFNDRIVLPLPFISRAQMALARAAAGDPLAFDLRAESVALCGWRILQLLTGVATEEGQSAAKARARARARAGASLPANAKLKPRPKSKGTGTIDQMLARAWGVGARGVDVLRSALILCADHELNVSSFTARCVASAGADPYAVVIAGLAALGGAKHGGIGARVDAMLDTLRQVRHARELPAALTERLRRGEAIHGIGHPLYRTGDPRATALFDLLRERYATSPELTFITAVANAATEVLREPPNIDFALAALTRIMRLPSGSALTVFALGRTIGWIGHAIEQYATDQLIRPRAKYVGALPGTA
jgi:citrate synthase